MNTKNGYFFPDFEVSKCHYTKFDWGYKVVRLGLILNIVSMKFSRIDRIYNINDVPLAIDVMFLLLSFVEKSLESCADVQLSTIGSARLLFWLIPDQPEMASF